MNFISLRILAWAFLSTSLLLTGSLAAGGRDPDAVRLASAYNDFGISLYNLITAENEGRNIFISPLSISIALAMTYNGASGETADEIGRILRLEGMDGEWINRSNKELLEKLGGSMEGVTLDIANSIWCLEGLEFDPLFLERTGEHYGAEARSLDFCSPGAEDVINGWVSEKTRGMIEEIVRDIDPRSILFLINAVYFKGGWKDEFDPGETREEEFHPVSGGVKRVNMMHRSGTFRYRSGEDYQAAGIPYGDGRMSMYIFLPDSASSLEEFHRNLPEEDWPGWLGTFRRRKGSIAMPRFRAEFETGIKALLARLGMERAFDRKDADFSGMVIRGPQEAWINEILHKAVVEVTEKGTEAAAVTSVNIVGAAFTPEEPFAMVLDRPFFFAIRDNETRMILFMGSIVDPERPGREW